MENQAQIPLTNDFLFDNSNRLGFIRYSFFIFSSYVGQISHIEDYFQHILLFFLLILFRFPFLSRFRGNLSFIFKKSAPQAMVFKLVTGFKNLSVPFALLSVLKNCEHVFFPSPFPPFPL